MEVRGFIHRRTGLRQKTDTGSLRHRYSPMTPAPGGVGAGVYFKESLLGFETSTAIHWRIVAPRFLGGTSDSLVYITSSNQAAKGPEALVAYSNRSEAVFRVWDWASDPQADDSRFVFSLPHSAWGSYRIPMQIDGTIHDTLHVVNKTHGSGTSWTNEVFLMNGDTQAFDLIYSHEFFWEPDPQSKFFGWGPIIEPFPPYDFGTTNRIGYAGAALVADGGVEEILTPQNTKFVNREIGFDVDFHEPNHTLLAS
jgi:hypothetical protein